MDALAANQPLMRRQILSSLTAVVVVAAAVRLAGIDKLFGASPRS